MARKTKRYTRGESTYELYQLGGMMAAELSVTVLNVVAGMLPLLLAAGKISNVDLSKVRLDWAQVQPLLERFAEHGYLVGKSGKVQLNEVFDEHFAGDLDGITELLFQGLELNYASFLERRLALNLSDVGKLWTRANTPSVSESQMDSTGTPGE